MVLHLPRFHGLFVKRETSYIIRKKLCLNIPRPKTNILQNSIAYIGAKLWNNLGNDVRSYASKTIFERAIKNLAPEFYTF